MRAEDGGIEAVVSACLTSDDVRREQSATLDARQIKMRVRRRVQNDGGMARTRSGARREAGGEFFFCYWELVRRRGANIAPDGFVFGTAERLGIERGHCWSYIFSFISKTRIFGMYFGY